MFVGLHACVNVNIHTCEYACNACTHANSNANMKFSQQNMKKRKRGIQRKIEEVVVSPSSAMTSVSHPFTSGCDARASVKE